MNKKEESKLSKFLSYILRHKPEKIWINLDENWWCDVNELIEKASLCWEIFDKEKLLQIVKNSDKQRFWFNSDQTRIRANQWHSIKVDLELEKKQPPDVLYHWTAEKNLESIKQRWLQKMKRHHVHLSENKNTALNVWKRYWKPVLLQVDAKQMHQDWIDFYVSDNWVWLVDWVDVKYISKEG